MKGSLVLGEVSGIRIKIHWTFILLIGWVVFSEYQRGSTLPTILLMIGFVLVIFSCVVLHELGHALMARRFGIKTRKITLLPIGGVASLEKMPEDPKQELLVAIAGPAVNLGIALLLAVAIPFKTFFSGNPEELISYITPSNFLFFVFIANILLVVFNAIPAFPMDGGRVLRALLSMKMDRVRATQLAARLGQILAVFFFFVGLFYNPFLVLIAIFVFFGAQAENMMVQQLAMLRGFKIKDAMITKISVLSPHNTIREVTQLLLSSTERHFIVVEETKPLGIVYQSDIIDAIKEKKNDLEIREIMNTQFEWVDMNDDLSSVYRKVQGKKYSFLPVLDQGHIAGAIDMANVQEFVMIQASLHY